MSEHKPCPMQTRPETHRVHLMDVDDMSFVECMSCGMRGPIFDNPASAWLAWDSLPRGDVEKVNGD